MQAVWYDEQGDAGSVLHLGELPNPTPGPGEVRVRVRASGVNPGDTKKRRGWLGSSMAYPRIVPHSDGAGMIDTVGHGVSAAGSVSVCGSGARSSYRPFGTAAQYTVVPSDHAVPLPDSVGDMVGAALGIPGITAHRAVFADGPVDGKTVVVQGVLGGVSSLAAQLATWGGATVIGTVRRRADLQRGRTSRRLCLRHRGRAHRPHPCTGSRRSGPGRRGGDVRQRRHGRRDPRQQRRVRRLRHPGGPAADSVLATSVQQRHHPPARQRRLLDRGKVASRC